MSGGIDGDRVLSTNSPSGSYAMRIRDNSFGASSFYTNSIDLSNYDTIQLFFDFIAVGMDAGESFLFEISNDGGSTFNVIEEWERDLDFVNDQQYQEYLEISSHQISSNSILRFRCDGSINADEVYIDNILLNGCQAPCLDYTID